MRVGIGIILIVTSVILFTVFLPENTPWILVTPPLFVIGFGFIYSKVHEMEEDIIWLETKLKETEKKQHLKE